MKKILRPYQNDLQNALFHEWERGIRSVLAVSPTGSGKALTLVDSAIKLVNQGFPVCIEVHRKELVQQLCNTLSEEGAEHNIIAPTNIIKSVIANERKMVGRSFYKYNSPITVASVDTLNSRIKSHESWRKNIKALIIDEAAHVTKTNKWGRTVEYFPGALIAGFTATPRRLDRRGLGAATPEKDNDGVFETMVEGPTVNWLIDEGYLANYRIAIPESKYRKFLESSSADADYTRQNMAQASLKSHIEGDVVESYKKYCDGKQVIVFASDIATAERMESEYNAAGVKAKVLTGDTSDNERVNALVDFREGKIKVLVNVDLFDEGLDVPSIEGVIMARPTKSLGKFLQMCLDTETEILTKRGWMTHDSIKKTDIVAAFNSENEHIEWCNIKELVHRPRDINEKMFSFKNPHLDFRITSQHDMVIKSTSGTSVNWIKETIDKSYMRKSMFRVPVAGFEQVEDYKIKDDELLLLGWFISDGTIRKASGQHQVTISQCENHRSYIEEIKDILTRLEVPFSETRVKRKGDLAKYADLIQISFGIFRPKRKFKRWIDKKDLSHIFSWFDKSLPYQYDNLSRRQIKILLETWNKGDGLKRKNINWNPKTLSITTGSDENLADRLQSILVRRGFRCNKTTEHRTKRGLINSSKTLFNLYIKDVTSSTIATNEKDGIISNKKYKRARIQIEEEHKSENVWCLSNRLGTIITRRNGKVTIMGNCGRGLRPVYAKGYDLSTREGRLAAQAAGMKPHAILIDHVGNIDEHGLPDRIHKWSLDRPGRRMKNISFHRICKNTMCNAPFDRTLHACPYCGHEDVPVPRELTGREALEQIDGDMFLLTPEQARQLWDETILETPAQVAAKVRMVAGEAAGKLAAKRQLERIQMQKNLSEQIAIWSGVQTRKGLTVRSIQKKFKMDFNMTITEALSMSRAEMENIMGDILNETN